METWKQIPFTNGNYEASDLGNIRSTHKIIIRSNGTPHTRVSKILKPAQTKQGYLKVAFSNLAGKLKSYQVSRLVCLAWHGQPLDKSDVNHINGIKTDNRPVNLEWCTHTQNMQHASKTGLLKPRLGSLNGNSKLTEKDVLEIRLHAKFNGKNYGRKSLAEKYGVSECTIKEVVSRRKNKFSHV